MCIRDRAWKGHEVLIATHIDKGHIHTHFIVNSVNYEDGHKLQWSKYDLKDLKERCNEQSREPVSYTHLDVYKRQAGNRACMCRRKERQLLEKSGKKRWHGAKTCLLYTSSFLRTLFPYCSFLMICQMMSITVLLSVI